jgi:hypothetical protein
MTAGMADLREGIIFRQKADSGFTLPIDSPEGGGQTVYAFFHGKSIVFKVFYQPACRAAFFHGCFRVIMDLPA